MEEVLRNVSLHQIKIKDAYWDRYINLVEKVILPFQWELINDNVEGAEKSYCIRNFKIAGGRMKGSHQGMVFQDTDVAKWLEAAAYSLEKTPNSELEKTADYAIDLIAGAQCEDGYLNTYYTIQQQKRWSDLFEGHELYTAGHMIEAAVAYYHATGKRKFLDTMCRFADYICETFGEKEGQLHGYPGHPEIELALVKLYRTTFCKRYLDLAYYFVQQRGTEPHYFYQEECFQTGNFIFPEFKDFGMDYCQAHKKVEQQMTAEGHAVRAVYLYSAMVDLAYEYQDKDLLRQCAILFDNIVSKRMYITGSIGSAAYGERFTSDYDLPNNTNYSETCATIGLAMFANRLFQVTRDGKYMDIVEKALYNTLLSGIAMDGKHFFYVNPLEVVPEVAEHNPTMRHVKGTRQEWFGVACCPPNIARTLASMGNYMYAVDQSALFVNLFINSTIETVICDENVTVALETKYPYEGKVKLTVNTQKESVAFCMAIRNPTFSSQTKLVVNGKLFDTGTQKGYYYINREWKNGDCVELDVDITPRFVFCNPKVRDNIGKVAVMAGPVVYCMEEADNGAYLSAIEVDTQKGIDSEYDEVFLGGTKCLTAQGTTISYESEAETLYRAAPSKTVPKAIKMIPYCLWNNREKGEMLVWINYK